MKLCRNYSIDMAISKAYQRFNTRMSSFRGDVEIADILCLHENNETLHRELFSTFDKDVHLALAARKRATLKNKSAQLLHMRSTLYVAFVKEMYEEVTEYFREILYQASVKGIDPVQLVDKLDITLTGADVLAIREERDVRRVVTDRLFRKLEGQKSALGLLQGMSMRLKLDVSPALMDAAIPYLKARHILVHDDGKPDADFRCQYPYIKRDANKRIKVDLDFVQKAYTAVDALIRAYDEAMIEKGLLPEGACS